MERNSEVSVWLPGNFFLSLSRGFSRTVEAIGGERVFFVCADLTVLDIIRVLLLTFLLPSRPLVFYTFSIYSTLLPF